MRALINITLPINEKGHFIGAKEFHQILETIGLKPMDMPPDDDEKAFKEYCLKRAEPIFERMPKRTSEERSKKQFSKDNIVYASDLPQSNTSFMVTAHTQSEYRFRLLNPKIEALEEGCKDLILKIRAFNKKHAEKQLELVGKIDVFEHGLEESTISGVIVKDRWSATRKIADRDILISAVGLLLFVTLTILNIFFIPNNTSLHTIADRLSTAMFTATIVSLLTVYHTYREAVPVIQWTTSYEHT